MIKIHPLEPDHWELYKRIRLAAPADALHALTTQLNDAVARPDPEWAAITARQASDPHGIAYFAFVPNEACAMASCVLTEPGAEMLAVWVVRMLLSVKRHESGVIGHRVTPDS